MSNILSADAIIKANGNKSTENTLKDLFQNTPLGSINTAIGNNLKGINHRQQPGVIPINKDHHGFTFFTRPNLNLTDENIYANERFANLLSLNPESLPSFLKHTLDPVLAWRPNGQTCPFVDELMPFIPILTNNLISCSGWPDMTLDSYVSPEGVMKECWMMNDSVADYNGHFQLTANFRNLDGDPISFLFYYWLHYMSAVYIGEMTPYAENVIDNTIDYQTRIWRLVVDPTKRFIQKIACCGAAMPTNNPLGNAFNFEMENNLPYNQANDQISITFNCVVAMYMYPKLINIFNRTSYIFNDALRPNNRKNHYIKVPFQLLDFFNNTGYPIINEGTYELEWWVPKDLYASKGAQVLSGLGLRNLEEFYKNPASADNTKFIPR